MNIKTEYVDDWRLLCRLSADWKYTQQEIYTALENEKFEGTDRMYANDLQSPILKDILDFTNSKVLDLLSELCEQNQFYVDLWHLENKEQILNNVTTMNCFICDQPGFTTSTHIDSRMTISSGMFFFNKDDDPDQSTYFYTTFDQDNPLRMSSQCGNGWYAANTHYSWHIGSNNSMRKRYALMFITKLVLK